MRVYLIDYTGMGHEDPYFAARKLINAKNTRISKSQQKHMEQHLDDDDYKLMKDELHKVAMSIRSSWEFVSYTFKIEDISRACCDQMTRSRVGCSFAVMAQRVVDNSHFEYVVPETIIKSKLAVEFLAHMKDVAGFYRDLIREGIPAQDARSVLPMATYSPLTAEYNLRALAGIVAKRSNLRAQGEYAEVAEQMKACVLEVHPWAEIFLDPERTRTPALEGILKQALGDGSPVDKPELNDALKELDLLKATWD